MLHCQPSVHLQGDAVVRLEIEPGTSGFEVYGPDYVTQLLWLARNLKQTSATAFAGLPCCLSTCTTEGYDRNCYIAADELDEFRMVSM